MQGYLRSLSQVQMFYKATLTEPGFEPGPESEDVQLYDWDEIPWKDIAFPSVYWALKDYQKVRGQDDFAPFSNPEKWKDV